MKMKLAEVAKAIGARNDITSWEDIEVTGVTFDSRQIVPGTLFIPLIGKRDGHQYVATAFDRGAVATLWARDHPRKLVNKFPHLVVDNTLEALQRLGKYFLQKVNPIVIAVTGSNGKTTTKDMIASILATQMNVTKTNNNFNNEIGVPITLLNMDIDTEVVVIEMGMDRFNQLDFLSRLVAPNVAVITMIGEAHIEFFGTRDQIANAKMEITHGLVREGTLVYNGDEPLLVERVRKLTQNKRSFGYQLDDNLHVTKVIPSVDHVDFTVNRWPKLVFTIPLVGSYNVMNALAAMVVGQLLHVTSTNMRKALRNVRITANRAEWVSGKDGVKILSDVYNSNPTAVKQVLTTFAKIPVQGKRVVVLGDMLELGKDADSFHANLAPVVENGRIDELYLVGPKMAILRDRLREDNYPAQIHYFQTTEQLILTIATLEAKLATGDVLLLKASHGLHFEELLAVLRY